MAAARVLAVAALLWCVGMTAVAQAPATKDAQARMDKVVGCMTPPVVIEGDAASQCAKLEDRMKALHVNGVSIAVVHNGVIDWAAGFGVREVGGCR